MMITVVGRGHGGTRAMSHTLTASGVHMGELLNRSGDLCPADDFYSACRVMAPHVVHKGGVEWDFEKLHTMPIDPAFVKLIESYLSSVLCSSPTGRFGWKLPETNLVFPWIVRMFPDCYYINWTRDPRDSILGRHITDRLSTFGVPCTITGHERLDRAISWKYQVEIVKATPKPRHWLTVRFEDFILDQDATLGRLESFLGFPLAKIIVRPESVGRWRRDKGEHDFDFLQEDLVRYGYKTEAGGIPTGMMGTPGSGPACRDNMQDLRAGCPDRPSAE